MQIIVMSDSHGNYSALEKVILNHTEADWIIHLGDGERELDNFCSAHPVIAPKIVRVAGNCDYFSIQPDQFILPALDHKIFAAHGHKYGVNFSLENLKKTAQAQSCDIILYGHTHVRCNKFEDGLYIMNPGSASIPRDGNKPSFGLIDISEKGILMNIAEI
ncbi:MAG: metallophosphoesterase [Ruminococcus sp.]|nr:metallophosphoesterase [Ruminococcus sp.]